jgi:acyl dehydratase
MAGQVYYDDVQEGQEIAGFTITPDRSQLVKFAAGSGDFNPLHYDNSFATNMGLPETIVHGRFKYALVGRLLSEWAGYQGRVKKFGVSYRGMDMPKREITVRGVVTKKYEDGAEHLVELDIWTESADGKKTTPGTAVVALPSRG